jgi:hypothetical protein
MCSTIDVGKIEAVAIRASDFPDDIVGMDINRHEIKQYLENRSFNGIGIFRCDFFVKSHTDIGCYYWGDNDSQKGVCREHTNRRKKVYHTFSQVCFILFERDVITQHKFQFFAITWGQN